MERDRERYLQKHFWMFQPHLKAIESNNTLQLESDNKLWNMVQGTQTAALQFVASDPMSKFIFNPITPVGEDDTGHRELLGALFPHSEDNSEGKHQTTRLYEAPSQAEAQPRVYSRQARVLRAEHPRPVRHQTEARLPKRTQHSTSTSSSKAPKEACGKVLMNRMGNPNFSSFRRRLQVTLA